jgi:hypothetical protein
MDTPLIPLHVRERARSTQAVRYVHLSGYHAHEWHRFSITAPTNARASQLAAALGFWLHCWDFIEGPDDPPTLAEREPPASFPTWEEYADSQGELPTHARRPEDGGPEPLPLG